MHAINVYFDESLSAQEIGQLISDIEKLPHVVDVEHPRQDAHNLTIEYEAHPGMPEILLEELRSRGLHPDVTSA